MDATDHLPHHLGVSNPFVVVPLRRVKTQHSNLHLGKATAPAPVVSDTDSQVFSLRATKPNATPETPTYIATNGQRCKLPPESDFTKTIPPTIANWAGRAGRKAAFFIGHGKSKKRDAKLPPTEGSTSNTMLQIAPPLAVNIETTTFYSESDNDERGQVTPFLPLPPPRYKRDKGKGKHAKSHKVSGAQNRDTLDPSEAISDDFAHLHVQDSEMTSSGEPSKAKSYGHGLTARGFQQQTLRQMASPQTQPSFHLQLHGTTRSTPIAPIRSESPSLSDVERQKRSELRSAMDRRLEDLVGPPAHTEQRDAWYEWQNAACAERSRKIKKALHNTIWREVRERNGFLSDSEEEDELREERPKVVPTKPLPYLSREFSFTSAEFHLKNQSTF